MATCRRSELTASGGRLVDLGATWREGKGKKGRRGRGKGGKEKREGKEGVLLLSP